jgi:hypothetical protein
MDCAPWYVDGGDSGKERAVMPKAPKTPNRPYKGAHTFVAPYKEASTSRDAVKKLLDENDVLLAQHKAALNTNNILRYLVNRSYQIETDLIRIHAKLQPILKSIVDDSDWRNNPVWRDEHE